MFRCEDVHMCTRLHVYRNILLLVDAHAERPLQAGCVVLAVRREAEQHAAHIAQLFGIRFFYHIQRPNTLVEYQIGACYTVAL